MANQKLNLLWLASSLIAGAGKKTDERTGDEISVEMQVCRGLLLRRESAPAHLT
jgi:hypothetical protein